MTRMLIKYWKEIIKWIPNATLFDIKRKQRIFFLFNNSMSTGKVVALARKVGRQHGKICRALTTSVSSFPFFKKQKQSKAIVYSTSQQCWSQLLLHNDYTSESVLDSQNAALWVKKKNYNNNNYKKNNPWIKENKTSGSQQRATLLLFVCLPFQISQHAAI